MSGSDKGVVAAPVSGLGRHDRGRTDQPSQPSLFSPLSPVAPSPWLALRPAIVLRSSIVMSMSDHLPSLRLLEFGDELFGCFRGRLGQWVCVGSAVGDAQDVGDHPQTGDLAWPGSQLVGEFG